MHSTLRGCHQHLIKRFLQEAGIIKSVLLARLELFRGVDWDIKEYRLQAKLDS